MRVRFGVYLGNLIAFLDNLLAEFVGIKENSENLRSANPAERDVLHLREIN